MRARRVVAILMALTLFAAACGDDDSDGPSGTDGASGTDAGGGTDDGADGPSGDGAAGEDGKESSTTDGGAAGAPTDQFSFIRRGCFTGMEFRSSGRHKNFNKLWKTI